MRDTDDAMRTLVLLDVAPGRAPAHRGPELLRLRRQPGGGGADHQVLRHRSEGSHRRAGDGPGRSRARASAPIEGLVFGGRLARPRVGGHAGRGRAHHAARAHRRRRAAPAPLRRQRALRRGRAHGGPRARHRDGSVAGPPCGQDPRLLREARLSRRRGAGRGSRRRRAGQAALLSRRRAHAGPRRRAELPLPEARSHQEPLVGRAAVAGSDRHRDRQLPGGRAPGRRSLRRPRSARDRGHDRLRRPTGGSGHGGRPARSQSGRHVRGGHLRPRGRARPGALQERRVPPRRGGPDRDRPCPLRSTRTAGALRAAAPATSARRDVRIRPLRAAPSDAAARRLRSPAARTRRILRSARKRSSSSSRSSSGPGRASGTSPSAASRP